jgi:hypothetical protein
MCDASTDDFAEGSALDAMIAQVPDHNTQAIFRLMRAESRHQYLNYCAVVQGAVATMQQSFNQEMASFRSSVMQPPMPIASGPLPQFIAADVQHSGSSNQSSPKSLSNGGSFSCNSSLTDRDIMSQDGVVIGLKCLFCSHYHVIEKSHCQHYDRLLGRVESGERYYGKCIIPDNHWVCRLEGFGDCKKEIVRKFFSIYLSHLHSGNEKNIDHGRASSLVAWLISLPRS